MYYIVVSKDEFEDPNIDKTDAYQDIHVMSVADDLDSASGYLLLLIENRDEELYSYRHAKVIDSEGLEHLYWFRYEWLPNDLWIRLNPVPQDLESIATAVGPIMRPNMLAKCKEYEVRR